MTTLAQPHIRTNTHYGSPWSALDHAANVCTRRPWETSQLHLEPQRQKRDPNSESQLLNHAFCLLYLLRLHASEEIDQIYIFNTNLSSQKVTRVLLPVRLTLGFNVRNCIILYIFSNTQKTWEKYWAAFVNICVCQVISSVASDLLHQSCLCIDVSDVCKRGEHTEQIRTL